jgi:hypothetical protein
MPATRRLAAILAADVAGYSRLMGADESGTRLGGIRAELTDPKIAEHHGRIVKAMGDGLLVEFASVIDALRCAGEVQTAMAERNAAIATHDRIEFRIGVNVGDVVVEDSDIFGCRCPARRHRRTRWHLHIRRRLSPGAWQSCGRVFRYTLAHQVALCDRAFDKAAAKLLLSIQGHPGHSQSYRTLAACYAHMGRLDEARVTVSRLRAITPLVVPTDSPFRNREDRELLLSGLRLAAGETT